MGNSSQCYIKCEKTVKGCVGECPQLICIDTCRVDYEKCRDNEDMECEDELITC